MLEEFETLGKRFTQNWAKQVIFNQDKSAMLLAKLNQTPFDGYHILGRIIVNEALRVGLPQYVECFMNPSISLSQPQVYDGRINNPARDKKYGLDLPISSCTAQGRKENGIPEYGVEKFWKMDNNHTHMAFAGCRAAEMEIGSVPCAADHLTSVRTS
jgi:hypothetical protein